MSEPLSRCPRCGAPVTADEEGTGSCLACLMSLGVDFDGADAADGTGEADRFEKDEKERSAADRPRGSDETERLAAGDAEQIAGYEIVRTLGEGGMGIVHLARQTEPIRRDVALKVIKLGMDTKKVVERFMAERQALAMMDHPAIAAVHEAGATREGRPYFAMEYVDGEPITSYCDRHRLTIRSRIELFIKVCEGVQHAHSKGIIHRDIKPTNVLVTETDGQAAPKIIDFGVAKAIEKRLTEQTMVTELGVLIGTPEYMSPEQAEVSPLDVDTRSDVYSLGVLLYELLTGSLPIATRAPSGAREATLDEIRRRIRDEDPPTPSRRLASLETPLTETAGVRRTDPAALRRQLRGDLDWIAAKALEKDRERRYGSPAELAADLARHLADEPVDARPPSRAYRIGKFARRNKLLVGSAAVILVTLIAAAAVATTFGLRAVRARDDLQQVALFQGQMLEQVDAEQMGRRLIDDLRDRGAAALRRTGASEETVAASEAAFEDFVRGINRTDAARRAIDEEILGRASAALDSRYEDEPLIEAQLRLTLGETYLKFGMPGKSERELRRAAALREASLGADDLETLDARYVLARAVEQQGRGDEALSLLIELLDVQRRVAGETGEATLRTKGELASIYKLQGRFDRARQLFEEVLAERERELGRDHPSTLVTLNGLADLFAIERRFDEAETLHLEIIDRKRRTLGEEAPETLGSMHNLARLYMFEGRTEEAAGIYRQVHEARSRILGDEHPDTLESLNNVALAHYARGDYEQAEPLFARLLAARRRVLGPEHPATLDAINNTAILYLMTERLDAAADLHRQVLAIRQRQLGDYHPKTISSRYNLATVLLNRGRLAEARSLLGEVLTAREEVYGREHPETVSAVLQGAFVAVLDDDRETALASIREAVDRGWSDASVFANPGFESLAGDAEFERLREIVSARAGEE